MEGLEIKESGRMKPATTQPTTPAPAQPNKPAEQPKSTGAKAMDILSDNFGSIMKLASDIVEIKKIETVTDQMLKKMEEDRKLLMDEAQAYAIKKRADTSSVVDRMNVIRSMMQDFYAQSDGHLSGDDFCKIITEVVNQMGRIENGIG